MNQSSSAGGKKNEVIALDSEDKKDDVGSKVSVLFILSAFAVIGCSGAIHNSVWSCSIIPYMVVQSTVIPINNRPILNQTLKIHKYGILHFLYILLQQQGSGPEPHFRDAMDEVGTPKHFLIYKPNEYRSAPNLAPHVLQIGENSLIYPAMEKAGNVAICFSGKKEDQFKEEKHRYLSTNQLAQAGLTSFTDFLAATFVVLPFLEQSIKAFFYDVSALKLLLKEKKLGEWQHRWLQAGISRCYVPSFFGGTGFHALAAATFPEEEQKDNIVLFLLLHCATVSGQQDQQTGTISAFKEGFEGQLREYRRQNIEGNINVSLILVVLSFPLCLSFSVLPSKLTFGISKRTFGFSKLTLGFSKLTFGICNLFLSLLFFYLFRC